MKICVLILLLGAVSARNSRERAEREPKNVYRYPCVNRWYNYYLDDEASEYGIRSGAYSRSNPSFIGRGFINGVLTLGNIQTNQPRGFYASMSGVTSFNRDPEQIWYLFGSSSSKYEWKNATVGESVTNGVEIGLETVGSVVYASRFSSTGPSGSACNPMKSGLFYGDDAQAALQATSGLQYQVLTCVSKTAPRSTQPKPKPPKYCSSQTAPASSSAAAPQCVHKWLAYKNDTQPATDGVNAGPFNNTYAYVGKVKIGSVWRPGRLQVVDRKGVYALYKGSIGVGNNGTFYLWSNPKYTYRWQDATGDSVIGNAVLTDESGAFKFPIVRTSIDGEVAIGGLGGVGGAVSIDGNGVQHVINNYQVLVCDPRPRFECAQQWKNFTSASSTAPDGINFSANTCKSPLYVGRHHTACTDEIGAINKTGISYIDDFTNLATFSGDNAQYLVKNSSYVYEWKPSSQGAVVAHALKVGFDTYVARFTVDGTSTLGTVRIGSSGIVTSDATSALGSYEVLTCYSPFEEVIEEVGVLCRRGADGKLCENNENPTCAPSITCESLGFNTICNADYTFDDSDCQCKCNIPCSDVKRVDYDTCSCVCLFENPDVSLFNMNPDTCETSCKQTTCLKPNEYVDPNSCTCVKNTTCGITCPNANQYVDYNDCVCGQCPGAQVYKLDADACICPNDLLCTAPWVANDVSCACDCGLTSCIHQFEIVDPDSCTCISLN